MTKAEIGNGKEKTFIDIPTLIDTRLLIQANSGGGKSWCIRKVLEETHGSVQHIVLDMEGEFGTLREKYDYILIGKEGDIPISIKTADLLAKRILELNVSAILDLYELKHHERILFVKRFLDSLINAPKKLWHPCLVVVDEAHVMCPEKGKSESMNSVIDLCTRGRKRGFCAILATQRLSKLHKDAAAELNNKLIGRTGLDIDMKRAGEELGFNSKQQILSLRDLAAGEFYAFGPAISQQIVRTKIGNVKTTHPKVGSRNLIVESIPARDSIKKILSKIGDLPKEAEEEMKSVADYKKRIRELQYEVRRIPTKEIVKTVEDTKRIRELFLDKASLQDDIKGKEKQIRKLNSVISQAQKVLVGSPIKETIVFKTPEPIKIPRTLEAKYKQPTRTFNKEPELSYPVDFDEKPNKCSMAVYSFLFANPERGFTKAQVAIITAYSPKSGGFNNALSFLNKRGYIRKEGNLIFLGTEDASLASDNADKLSIEVWLRKLPKCSKEIFSLLLENPDEIFHKDEIAEQTGYSSGSGGFNNAISKLNALELIRRVEGGIKLNPEVRELEDSNV